MSPWGRSVARSYGYNEEVSSREMFGFILDFVVDSFKTIEGVTAERPRDTHKVLSVAGAITLASPLSLDNKDL
jgi:hypothetical protein